MTSPGERRSVLAILAALGGSLLAWAGLLTACTAQAHLGATTPSLHASRSAGTATAHVAARVGTIGTFAVRKRGMRFVEPAHAGVTGASLATRRLLTEVYYPLAGPAPAAARAPAKGPLPMLIFAPGFMQCGAPYSKLLRAWASAGYVVVVVNFPLSDCEVGSAATESDMVNQPGDMSFVIARMLALSAAGHGFFSGLIDPRDIAVTGQSDGGDTVAAMTANTCCTNHRVAAVAVLSGAEWPPMPGQYFVHHPVPMLFTQGSADTINPPGCSVTMYRADPDVDRHYLDLLGASHTGPYWGANAYERIVARVTTAFFDRYVLDRNKAGRAMRRFGNVPGLAVLYNNGQGQFPSLYCNT